jgi:hypothetical protein
VDLQIHAVEGVNLFRYAAQPVFTGREIHVHMGQFEQNVRHGVPPVADTSTPPAGPARHWR